MSKKKKIAIILGTRPEIIKMCSVIRELVRQKSDFFIVHTNQHYANNLDSIFFNQLNIPAPKYNLNIGSGSHGEATGKMIAKIEKILIKESPHIVLVQGDTNTVLSGAIAASKLSIKIGHIEAGLRSRDESMPEETNRILTDHCSSFLFVPTDESRKNLLKENINPEKIFLTGNTIVDSLTENLEIALKKSKIMEKMQLNANGYFLATAHRQENVDTKKKIANIFKGLNLINKKFGLPVIFSAHPRTIKRMTEFQIKEKSITLIEPVGYFDFIQLMANARLILTDSGGIQEEACILKKPCVTLRENTERPETIAVGGNILAGTSPLSILEKTSKMMKKTIKWHNPFGDLGVSKKILSIIRKD